MGDVATHAQITTHVVEQLKQAVGARAIPESDYSYLELGNFLTDVKQFRDPVAFHKGRERARDTAKAQLGGKAAAGAAGVDKWAIDIFGQKDPPGPTHGALPEFLRLLAYAFTHDAFDNDGASSRQAPNPTAAHAMDPAEVDRVLDERFDQYWPHDHMDFPPLRDEDLRGHRDDRWFQRTRLGVIRFVLTYVEYLTEELAKLELEWATAAASQLKDQEQRDFLVRLGTLLHAVEDFFFHSNVAELRQWQVLGRLFSGRDRDEIFRRGLSGTGLDESSVHLRRLMYRRLRYPVFDPDGTLSRTSSQDATDLLYTGGFYTADVYHTLGGALEAVERLAPFFDSGQQAASSPLILVRLAFHEDARRNLVRGGERAITAQQEQHVRQLNDGAYRDAIIRRRNSGKIAGAAAARLEEAFALDKSHAGGSFPSPGSILVQLLADLQRERDESARAAAINDTSEDSITANKSFNTATGENVGTHSLMSKDSKDKEPFREDALVLAKHASAGVATTLARRLNRRVPIDNGVDWNAVLLFFLRFPKHPSLRWEEELLVNLRAPGSFQQPDVNRVADRPPFPLLGPAHGGDALARMRSGKRADQLRRYYQSFESNPKH